MDDTEIRKVVRMIREAKNIARNECRETSLPIDARIKIEEMGAQAAIKLEEMKQAPAKPEGGAKAENAKKEGE